MADGLATSGNQTCSPRTGGIVEEAPVREISVFGKSMPSPPRNVDISLYPRGTPQYVQTSDIQLRRTTKRRPIRHPNGAHTHVNARPLFS